jgi:heat shock protein HtpX
VADSSSRTTPTADSAYDRVAREAPANRRRAGMVVAAVSLPVPLVAGLVLGLLLAWWAGVLALVGLWVGLAAWSRRAAPRLALSGLPLRRVGNSTRPEARIHNLVESLCALGGLPHPDVLVLDDPAIDALVVGWKPATAALVVTGGLLQHLTRVEMEGVLAQQLVRIRRGDAAVSTASALVAGLAGRLAPSRARSWVRKIALPPGAGLDAAAIALTRFPPGLTSALEKMGENRYQARSLPSDWLWDVPPVPSASEPGATWGPDRDGLTEERVAALREL